jgi:hypothetical protein
VTDKTTVVPVSELAAGAYLLQISNGVQRATQRFIKQ